MNPAGCCNFLHQWTNDVGSSYIWFYMDTPGSSRAYSQKNGDWNILIQYVFDIFTFLDSTPRVYYHDKTIKIIPTLLCCEGYYLLPYNE